MSLLLVLPAESS